MYLKFMYCTAVYIYIMYGVHLTYYLPPVSCIFGKQRVVTLSDSIANATQIPATRFISVPFTITGANKAPILAILVVKPTPLVLVAVG